MKIPMVLAAVAGLLLPALLAAQIPGDDFESHSVQHGTTVWFGKSRNKILGYAGVTTKTGVVTTDHRTNRDYEEDKTRYDLSVVVATPESSTATAEAKVRKVVRYTDTSSAVDILVDVTTPNTHAEWTLRLETSVDYANSAWHKQGTLVSGGRSIDIVFNRSPLSVTEPLPEFAVEFIESGSLLGAIGDGVYLFRRNLDPDLKLVLAAAMQVADYRHMQ